MVALRDDWKAAGFGLYIHWPFCEAKCPYCDFNSHVSRTVDQDAWRVAYLEELERYARETPGRRLNSIFFGGGTPSLMNEHLVADIIAHAQRLWTFANDIEITLEANPSSVEADRFAGYRTAGVNRISIGIQALNNEDLRRLGRLHNTRQALTALDVARSVFSKVSFDLIYARQDQTLSDWETELQMAIDLNPDHLSLYQLTIEPNTAFGDRYAANKLGGLPGEDDAADMFDLTHRICDSAGLGRYEVSNHAKSGFESIHNTIYWKYGDYVGIGPGAHGRLTLDQGKVSTIQTLNPSEWLTGRRESDHAILTREDVTSEFILMGLRRKEGVSLVRLASLSGIDVSNLDFSSLRNDGWVSVDDGKLQVTDKGIPLLNAVIGKVLESIE